MIPNMSATCIVRTPGFRAIVEVGVIDVHEHAAHVDHHFGKPGAGAGTGFAPGSRAG